MPVHRADFRRRALREPVRWTKQDICQREHAAQQVQAVRRCENVEKAATRIRRQKQARSPELLPGDDLPQKKERAENRRDAPPVTKASLVVCLEKFARASERETACDQDGGVEPKNSRHC